MEVQAPGAHGHGDLSFEAVTPLAGEGGIHFALGEKNGRKVEG